MSLILKNNYEKQNNDKKELKELNSKEYQAIIDSYAASVDIAVQNYIQTNNGDIPEFSDIEKLIVFESYKVSCEDSQINYDKSIYLANCKINNYKENANIVYGKKLTPPPQSGKNLYFYKVTSTYQDPSTGQTETQTYYNSYKELLRIKKVRHYNVVLVHISLEWKIWSHFYNTLMNQILHH